MITARQPIAIPISEALPGVQFPSAMRTPRRAFSKPVVRNRDSAEVLIRLGKAQVLAAAGVELSNPFQRFNHSAPWIVKRARIVGDMSGGLFCYPTFERILVRI